MSMQAVEIRSLDKSFGHTKALDGLDLTVAPGDITGFLGPNGAGKSTTIRVLLGLLRADTGTVRLLGGDPWRDQLIERFELDRNKKARTYSKGNRHKVDRAMALLTDLGIIDLTVTPHSSD